MNTTKTMKMNFSLVFTCFITLIFFCSSSENVPSGDINWWCSQTPHAGTCNYYIRNRPSTPSAAIARNEFLDMTVRAGLANALVVLNQTKRFRTTSAAGSAEKALWSSCVEYVDGIVFRLNMTLDRTIEPTPTPLDVQSWLSSGLTYVRACEQGFETMNITSTVFATISTNLTQLISNSLAIGILSLPGFPHSTFSDENQLSRVSLEGEPNVVVAQDGSGNFTTVQAAIDAAMNRSDRAGRFVIYVKTGIYNEHVIIEKPNKNIMIYGDGIDRTVITGRRRQGMGNEIDLKETATFTVWGDDFIARDMTFQNTAGALARQAVAVLAAGHRLVFYHCSFEGYQDTLYTFANQQFYKECQIYGTVDFIFGNALVVFQDCEILFRKPPIGCGLVAAAHGRDHLNQTTGYSMQGCKVTTAPDLGPIKGHYAKAFLGRPWFQFAITVYMECFLDDWLDPKGWMDDDEGSRGTIYFGEYQNNGPGSSTDGRVQWPGYHIITDQQTAENFTVDRFIHGELWLPATGVPFTPGLQPNR